MKLCECGCGQPVTKVGNRFLNGHNLILRYKMGLSMSGNKNPMYKKHQKPETIEKIRNWMQENEFSRGERNPFYGGEITRMAWREGKYDKRPKPHQDWVGKTLEEIHGNGKAQNVRKTMSNSAKVKPRNEEQIKRWNQAGIEYLKLHPELYNQNPKRGKDNPAWKGGISKLPYTLSFNTELRTRIKERDGYVCQLCGCSNPKKLVVHHINYDKSKTDEDMLITLCRSCNIKVNTNRTYWTVFFKGKVRKIEASKNRISN